MGNQANLLQTHLDLQYHFVSLSVYLIYREYQSMTDVEPLPEDKNFTMWVNRPGRGANYIGRRGAIIKRGRDVTKTVTLTDYGNKSTGAVSKRELRFRTHEIRRGENLDYDEPAPKTTWWCEGDEVERVRAFLQSEVIKTGRYKLVDVDSSAAAILDALRDKTIPLDEIAYLLLESTDPESLAILLSSSGQGAAIAQMAVIEKRRALIRDLRSLVENPATREGEIQKLIGQSYWIFGGRYVGTTDRRGLIPLDQYDIPLLGADGTLHIVELKRPRIPDLITHHRNHWIVGPSVNESVGQAMNYIRGLDENGAAMSHLYQNELGHSYGMRRVFATVVVGHPMHVTEQSPERQRPDEKMIADTIRSYNSYLSRVEVLTYKDLVDSAERALNFEDETNRSTVEAAAVSEIEVIPEGPARFEGDRWAEEPPF